MKQEFFAKAEENLKTTELLFEQGLYNAAANRAYYAAFHAAISALSVTGINVNIGDRISHEAVHSNFAIELIQRRKIHPNYLKSYLIELQSVRNDADYRVLSVSKNVATKQLKRTKEFVDAVRRQVAND